MKVPPLSLLGIPHSIIRRVGEGDQSRTTNSSYNHDVSHLAHDSVGFQGSELSALGHLEGFDHIGEEIYEGTGARSTASEDLERSTSGTDLGDIPCRNRTRVEV